MRLRLDRERCMGNAVCLGIAPDAFRLDEEGYAEVVEEHPQGQLAELARQAARHCPTNAIFLEVD